MPALIRSAQMTASLLLILTAVSGPATVARGHGPDGGAGRDHLAKACGTQGENYQKTICLAPHFAALTRERSAGVAVARAQEMEDRGRLSDCHLIAHHVGEANLEKYGFNLGRALATCSAGCLQGCIHGAVQAFVSRKDSFEGFIAELGTVCNAVSDDAWLRRQCVHGVGHGFLTGDFLPLEKAIKACHEFKGGEADVCLGGLFVEHMQGYLLLSEAELRAEIPNICARVMRLDNDVFSSGCHDAIGEGMMFYTAHDLAKSLEFCGLLAGPPKYICMEAAINEARHAPLRFDPARLRAGAPAPAAPVQEPSYQAQITAVGDRGRLCNMKSAALRPWKLH
jgi:hypothetical protein